MDLLDRAEMIRLTWAMYKLGILTYDEQLEVPWSFVDRKKAEHEQKR